MYVGRWTFSGRGRAGLKGGAAIPSKLPAVQRRDDGWPVDSWVVVDGRQWEDVWWRVDGGCADGETGGSMLLVWLHTLPRLGTLPR